MVIMWKNRFENSVTLNIILKLIRLTGYIGLSPLSGNGLSDCQANREQTSVRVRSPI